jgi:predicted CoA-binding protein
MENRTPLARIEEFLAQRRLAMVGVSTNPKDFSRVLFREFLDRGYDMVAVNPEARGEIDEAPVFADVTEIEPRVAGAILMTTPAVTEVVVRQCAAAGISRVWMYRATGKGAVSQEAIRFCEAQGIAVIGGECPFMYLPGTMWLHRLHGTLRRAMGTYAR